MLRAADYRERARASLSGNWGMAVLVCFVGALLGGIQSVIPVTANYQYGEGMSVQIFGINMSLNQLPAEMLGILAVMMSILSIYALAQFVIGGVVELGMCAYFSKRALGENADIKDEFAYFQYFGKALGLRIVTSIFTCCIFSSYNLNSTVFVPFFILSKGFSFNFILCIIFFLLYLILKSIVHYFLPHLISIVFLYFFLLSL